ncbi:MAG: hypothetical protein HYS21_03990 [Deltaproteobacteria bacterium]|nr:hypothetical protein [Deltaproteobacteria bacterium]
MKKKLLMALLAISLTSCTTLSSLEKTKIAELKAKGVIVPHEELKNPGAAGVLNILPGFGNFYLAIGTNEGEQWMYGVLNLLFWPISIVWAAPEAAIDADSINKRNTVYYYTYGQGAKELQANQQPVPVQPTQAVQPAPVQTETQKPAL